MDSFYPLSNPVPCDFLWPAGTNSSLYFDIIDIFLLLDQRTFFIDNSGIFLKLINGLSLSFSLLRTNRAKVTEVENLLRRRKTNQI